MTSFLDLIIPNHCAICKSNSSNRKICSNCSPQLISIHQDRCSQCFKACRLPCEICRIWPPPYDQLIYLWTYDAFSRDYIRTMKYQPSITLLKDAALRLKRQLTNFDLLNVIDCIVPIPSSPKRQKLRGMNHIHQLAKYLVKNLDKHNKPDIVTALDASRIQKAQTDQSSAHGRIKNMHKGLLLKKSNIIEGKNILLLDDVITTGASTYAASYMLKTLNPLSITVLSLAAASSMYQYRFQLHRKFSKKRRR